MQELWLAHLHAGIQTLRKVKELWLSHFHAGIQTLRKVTEFGSATSMVDLCTVKISVMYCSLDSVVSTESKINLK